MTKQQILQEFRKKFGSRLDSLELSYQNHGGSAWTDETIPDWLSQALDEVEQEAMKETISKIINIINTQGGWQNKLNIRYLLLEQIDQLLASFKKSDELEEEE